MHRFRSFRPIIRLYAASLAMLGSILALLAAAGGGVAVLVLQERQWAVHALVALGAAVGLGLLHLIAASAVRCPLCLTKPLIRTGCQKHWRAKRLFGSYRLRVALGAACLRHFRCPYCGEPCHCSVRDGRGPAAPSDHRPTWKTRFTAEGWIDAQLAAAHSGRPHEKDRSLRQPGSRG